MYIFTIQSDSYIAISINTHDSESCGEEEVDHTQQMSELFTHSTGLKFVNAFKEFKIF